ncbi:hypothetical protein QOT17_021271 [Balamuthia mandrillaris]
MDGAERRLPLQKVWDYLQQKEAEVNNNLSSTTRVLQCPCGLCLEDDSAHILSNALIVAAGYSELDAGPGESMRKGGRFDFVVCSQGRPIKADDLQSWLKRRGTQLTERPVDKNFPPQLYLNYQEPIRGKSHVVLRRGEVAAPPCGAFDMWPVQQYFVL